VYSILPRLFRLSLTFVAVFSTHLSAQQTQYSFAGGQTFLSTYCKTCHQGKSAAGGFDVQRLSTPASLGGDPEWTAVISRVKNSEMPPKGMPAPDLDGREKFTIWAEAALKKQVCAGGITPGPAPIHRLNRDEYTATVQYLLNLHMDIGQSLPADGAGGEGFDNAAEALVLSPIHAEKYMATAKLAMDFASKEFLSRQIILVAKPGPGVTQLQAAHEILKSFLPRAFRRPVTETEIAPYVALFQAAQKKGMTFESAVFFTLRGVLVSPQFLFHIEPQNNASEVRPLDQYALAARLSYFLWGTMPEPLLFDLAAAGKLNQPEVLKAVVHRMLQDQRSTTFADRFVGQWLRTRELGTIKVPDAKMFPGYANEELRSDIGYQPILFFREILSQNLSLLNLIDSRYTILTRSLADHYREKPYFREKSPVVGKNKDTVVDKEAADKKEEGGAKPKEESGPKKVNQQPQWVELAAGSQRGGLLGMAAILGVSSYSYRTSPVLRGAWVLESMLGTPPPAPPPVVPALPEDHEGAAPTSVRERLTMHRADPVCANCHARIDPLGFALENFDALGRWRDQDGGKSVDSSAELIDGTKFQGPAGLKSYLMDHKDLVIHNLASKMLGYALGRGLTLKDSCTVDDIVSQVKADNYSAQTLIEATVLSVPFRYQASRSPIQEKKP
jgi:uncharacterized protein DUF1592/uncharacterized protein DUF1588/uncharacterized protein DUF1585/uncharacterized protein DUF1595/uncharacterized protein DUF1587/cytochrome c